MPYETAAVSARSVYTVQPELRERERETETDRDRETGRDRDRETETERQRQRDRQRLNKYLCVLSKRTSLCV